MPALDCLCNGIDIDGTVEYTFKTNGTYQVYAYDALSVNEVTRTHEYTLDGNVITLNTAATDSAHREGYTYILITNQKLTPVKNCTRGLKTIQYEK